MNTQNVNVNTATPESPKTWVNNPSITFISRKTRALIRLAKTEGDLMMYRAFERLGIDSRDYNDEICAPQEAAFLVKELADIGGITTPAVYDMVRSVEALAQGMKLSCLWDEEYPENLPELAVFQAASAEKKARTLRSMKTVAPVSADVPEIPGLSQVLVKELDYLAALSTRSIDETVCEELLSDTILYMAERICDTVTDWTGDVLPLASFRAWILASHIVHERFGLAGEVAWGRASGWLAGRLGEISDGASGRAQA